ncbi:MAG TPA: phenylalanine--tRNA ligase subunit alpha, partial [Firmicutes bacterium]|nr:phenylalanine--tRNA ligase subunit alpha [Bacillota bacterium]
MQAELSAIQEQAIQEIQGATSSPDLEELRLKYFGKKGVVTQ